MIKILNVNLNQFEDRVNLS